METNTRGTRHEATEDEYMMNGDSGVLLRSPLAAPSESDVLWTRFIS